MKSLLQKSAITIALLCANQAFAGGLWITEYGQPTQGRAGAGEEAGNGDATDAFLNPASMSRLEKSEILVSAGAIVSNIEFDVQNSGIVNGTGDGGDAGGPAPAGSVFYVHPLNDRWTAGI